VRESLDLLKRTEGVLARIGNVKEAILILMLLIDAAHERSGWWQDFIDEDEDSLLWGELDALADYVDELAYGEVGRDQILLLVDRRDIAFLDFLADYRDTVRILLANTLTLRPTLLEGVLILKLGSHDER